VTFPIRLVAGIGWHGPGELAADPAGDGEVQSALIMAGFAPTSAGFLAFQRAQGLAPGDVPETLDLLGVALR
jgi:hypothetical protein